MDSLYRLLIRLRLPVLLASLAVTVWLGSHLGDVKFDTSTNGSVPRGDEAQHFYEEAIDTFGNDVVSVAVVVADGPLGVFAPATLRKIGDLTRNIEGFEGVQEVVSLTNAVYLRGALMRETAPLVPDIPDHDAAAARRLHGPRGDKREVVCQMARLRLPQRVCSLLVCVPLPLHSSSFLEDYGTPLS